MNEIIRIEKARLMKKGEYQTGVGEYGQWRRINLRLQWQYMTKDAEGQPKVRTMAAVFAAKGDLADKAKDLVVGNLYLHTPETYVNITATIDGRIVERDKKDGGKWEIAENALVLHSMEVIQG